MQDKTKYTIATLAASAAFFVSLIQHEGNHPKPYKDGGGVATIGIGSTTYENGTKVKMTDKPISKERAIEISKVHVSKDEALFKKSLQGVRLSQTEYDIYLDFIYQYGQSTWANSSMRKLLIVVKHKQACERLLLYKYVAKKDCSIRKNNCYGVWTRQLERHKKCIGANS